MVILLEGTGDTTTQKHGRYFFGSEHLVWREFLDDDLAWSLNCHHPTTRHHKMVTPWGTKKRRGEGQLIIELVVVSYQYIKKKCLTPFYLTKPESALDQRDNFTPSPKYLFSALFLSFSRFKGNTGIDSQNDTLYYSRFRYSQLNLD